MSAFKIKVSVRLSVCPAKSYLNRRLNVGQENFPAETYKLKEHFNP